MSTLYGSCTLNKMTSGVGNMKTSIQLVTIISAIYVHCIMMAIRRMDVTHALPVVLSPNGTSSTVVCLDYTPSVGVRWYSPTEQLCCNGLHNRTTATQQCCFGSVYDTADSLCCGHDPYPRGQASEQIACCNDDVLYDPTSQLCCNGTLYNVTSDVGCCSDVTYNKSTDTCCNGTVQPTFGTYNWHGRCCGDRNYNMQCYKCNRNNAVVPHFDTVRALCCNGNVILKLGTNSECCGRLVLNPDVSVCRNGSIQRKKGFTTDIAARYGPTDFPGAWPSNTSFTQDTEGDGRNHVIAIVLVPILVAIAALAIICRYKNKCFGTINVKNNYCHEPSKSIRASSTVFNQSNPAVSLKPEEEEEEGKVLQEKEEEQQQLTHVDQTNSYHYEKPQHHQQQLQQHQRSPDDQNNTYECDRPQQTQQQQQQMPLDGQNNTHQYQQQREQQIETLPDRRIPYIEALMKESSNYKGNMVADYITETGTQTCIRKECNRRNVFGEPYEFKSILDSSNSTFEMDASSAKLVLPAKLLRNAEVETHGATFRSIPAVMATFGISHDDKIASPAVEYFLTGYPELPDHAVCILPFVGRREDLRVWKFKSDEGMHETIESQTVPEKGKENDDADLYYIVKDRHVYIYTKSLSGFYCTTCGRRELSLQAYVFGSYKKIQNFEIRLAVYIADEILKFEDYSKRMYDNEKSQGRVQKLDQPINLLPELTINDLLRLRISPTGVHREGWWEHKLHPVDNRPIKAEEQEIPLSWVVKCHGLPYFVEWYLICTKDDPDFTFQCVVDVDCQKHDDSACVERNLLVVDELRLRSEDLPGQYEGNAPVRLQDIKNELSMLDDDQRSRLAAKLSNQVPLPRETENISIVLDELQNCGNSNWVVKTIASALRSLRYYDVLDRLCDVELIPPDYAGLPVQPVTRDATALPMATCCGALPASRQDAGTCCDEQSSESDPLLQPFASLIERQLQASTPSIGPVLPLPTPATERPLQASVSLTDQTVQASVPSFTRQSQPGGDDPMRLGDGSGGGYGRARENTRPKRPEQPDNKVPVRRATRRKSEESLNRGENLQQCILTSSKTEPDTVRLDNLTRARSNLLDKPLRQELAEKESRHFPSQHGHDGVNENLIPEAFTPDSQAPTLLEKRDIESDINELPVEEEATSSLTEIDTPNYESPNDGDDDV